MSAEQSVAVGGDAVVGSAHDRLKPNAIGLVGVVFMVVAFSAPITAMTGNLPVAVGFGNGIGAPAGFIVAAVVLTIFSLGFTALARHITSAGAFYTFVSRALWRPLGLASGMTSMVCYMSMEAGLIGIFSFVTKSTVDAKLGIDLPWLVWALIGLVVISVLSYRDLSVVTKVLSCILILELTLLGALSFSVLFHGGGTDGLVPQAVNPINAFGTKGVIGGSAGLGILFAFWSWVGFESTAIYGEESKDPKRIIPRATLIAVIGIGVVYAFISWMVVAGNGQAHAVARAASANPFELLYAPLREFLGNWSVDALDWLVIGSSFACALAIHNTATRYLFAFGRDGFLWKRLGNTHATHRTPHIASTVQTGIAVVIVVACAIGGVDPYAELFVLVAILATVGLLVVQALSSAACINFFHVRHEHPETASWWRTLLAPTVGGIAMLYVVYLLLTNLSAAAGAASKTLFAHMIPYIIVGILVVATAAGVWMRSNRPELYRRIGSTVFDDIEEEPIR